MYTIYLPKPFKLFLRCFERIPKVVSAYKLSHSTGVGCKRRLRWDIWFLLAYCGKRVNEKYFILHNTCSSLIMALINYNVKNLFKKKISSCFDPRTSTKYAVEEKLV